MRYKLQIQRDDIRESIRARYAMVIPILRGMLNCTAAHILQECGGRDKITLEVFARIYAESFGDYGICFEYAVHQAIRDRHASIHPLVSQVLEDFCGINGEAESILFGIEKNGAAKVIETAKNSLTNESRVLAGGVGQPPRLKKRLDDIAKTFHSKGQRNNLPQSISGLWKADLFIGVPSAEQWIATTLKTNRKDFQAMPGLRLGLYPEERRNESPKKEGKLVMCPLPYSGEFMQLFGASFQIVKQIIAAKGKMPSRVALVYDDDMEVAKWLVDRAKYSLLDILDALEPLKQPEFLEENTSSDIDTKINDEVSESKNTEAAAPIPKIKS